MESLKTLIQPTKRKLAAIVAGSVLASPLVACGDSSTPETTAQQPSVPAKTTESPPSTQVETHIFKIPRRIASDRNATIQDISKGENPHKFDVDSKSDFFNVDLQGAKASYDNQMDVTGCTPGAPILYYREPIYFKDKDGVVQQADLGYQAGQDELIGEVAYDMPDGIDIDNTIIYGFFHGKRRQLDVSIGAEPGGPPDAISVAIPDDIHVPQPANC